jgi:hypothetical protein
MLPVATIFMNISWRIKFSDSAASYFESSAVVIKG